MDGWRKLLDILNFNFLKKIYIHKAWRMLLFLGKTEEDRI